MKEKIYIDTTIPSLYYDERPKSAYRREQTRLWWDTQKQNFECYSSYFVEIECTKKEFPNQDLVVEMTLSLPYLAPTDEIREMIDIYITNYVMPKDAFGDAAHLAMASFYGMEYLLTWNCNHLANALKSKHIEKTNLKLGLLTPKIVTPEQLFEEEENAR